MTRLSPLAWIAMLTLSTATFAQEYRIGDIRIDHAYARPTVPAQTAGGAYADIHNLGKTSDQLVSVASPVASRAELHTMSMQNNVMKMREVESIDIKPAEKVAMTPGHGFHIMLIGLKQPLKPGDKVPLSLRFKHAGTVEIQATVEDMSGSGAHGMKPSTMPH